MSEKLKTDVIMISDSDNEDVDYTRKMGESNPENEAKQKENSSLESDESSGSLATGESELESGEITDDSSCSDMIMDAIVCNDQSTVEQLSDSLTEIADNYPPCIRVIVEASEHLPLGSLYIITCAGGSIGREQNTGHAIEICDSNISKIHAEVSYDYENSCYVLIDKGSQNGTFLNSKRMSKSKCTSENHKLAHGDVVEIGSTKLLLHIHKGHETCEECEPGQVQAKIKAQNPIKNDYVLLSKEEKNRLRRNQLKNIKKKYGLQNTHFENPGAVLPGSDYCDKAYLRRKYIGSESNATGQDDTPASVQSPISTENKGHKLLAKMGWKEGEGLGKSNSGIAEPIYVEMRVNQSAGLGSSSGVTLSLDNIHNTAKAKRWSKAQQRFHQSGHSGDSVTTPSTDIPAKEHYTSPLNSAAKGASSITADSQHSFDPHNHSSDHSNQNSSPKVKQMSWVSGGTETIGQVDQLLTLSQAADGEENISPLGS
ncbi:angiogenic factor with G patch and FHA domains 1 [Biomphalaria glabrata]|nr:angiogenic factor with G patch and FHA domains 1 [Biomphalaria glabrata]